jgi:hypothetical protein
MTSCLASACQHESCAYTMPEGVECGGGFVQLEPGYILPRVQDYVVRTCTQLQDYSRLQYRL